MKNLFALLLTLALCLSVGAMAAPSEDRAGEPIRLPETIEKIVSMAPSTTRVLTDLGLADKLLAVDSYSAAYQPELAALPQFDMMTPDTEQLAALQPDVIFITGMSLAGGDNPYQALIDLGIAVVQIPSSSSIADIQQDVLFIGDCVGAQDKAQALVDDMQAAIDEIAAIGATVTEKKRVAVEVAALPYLCCAGGNTYLDEMLRLIGAENAYADSEPWASVTEEAAVAANPDVILTCISYLDDPVGEILGREGWGEVAAIKNGQVYRLDDESTNQPNHRIVIALRQMAEAVYPEIYGVLDAAA